jgi:hypothetical protein
MKNEKINLVNKAGKNTVFAWASQSELNDFIGNRPNWMRKERHDEIIAKINSPDFELVAVASTEIVPDPMPERRKNRFGGFIED